MGKCKKKKGVLLTLLLVLALIAGLSLLLYPTVADFWNSLHQSRAIASYVESVEELDDEAYEEIWAAAQEYNAALPGDDSRFVPDEEELERYESLLNVGGDGIMGYVEIEKIDVLLPIYHGASEEVLQVAIGHIPGSSLPVGGAGTHCVISGHRGLPSAKLFTDLDQLEDGDTFMLHVLGETLTYEVDQIRIVEPDDLTYLALEPGADYCTLVTCTPYGVNSHRLLVRGHRIETPEEETDFAERILADARLFDNTRVAAILTAPILLLMLLGYFIVHRRTGR